MLAAAGISCGSGQPHPLCLEFGDFIFNIDGSDLNCLNLFLLICVKLEGCRLPSFIQQTG